MSNEKLKYEKEPGVLDIDKMRQDGLYPSDERINQGPIAVFECGQRIPCNPCEKACKKGYIKIGDEITAIPRLDERCRGCGLCVASCPGLSIFIINGAYSEDLGTVTMPYEFMPLPEPEEDVIGVNRQGEDVCEATVTHVRKGKDGEVCHCVTVAIPKKFIHDVRHIRRKEK